MRVTRTDPKGVVRLSKRQLVFTAVLLAQLATVAALVLLSGRLTSRAESVHTNTLLNDRADVVADRVRVHLAPAEWMVTLTSGLAANSDVEFDPFVDAFREALEISPHLAGFYIAEPNGNFLYVSRFEDGFRFKQIAFDETGRTTELTFYDLHGEVTEHSVDPDDTYDPTQRPWYAQALGNPHEIVWTDPYVFFTSRELGITAAQAIWQDGEIVGVVGADLELGSLSHFLSDVAVGEHGGAVITNSAGIVIAHPDPSLIQKPDGDGFRTVNVDELADPAARAATATFAQSDETSSEVFHFAVDQPEASRAVFRSVPLGDQDWSIALYSPEGDLVADLAAARSAERWLTVGVGLLSMIMFGMVASLVTKPIQTLEDDATTDLLTGISNRRAIYEVLELEAEGQDSFAVAMVDLDFFKQVNDSHGHPIGDMVLRTVAQRIEAVLRDGSSLGRVGGEEFLVVFPGVSRAEAIVAAERVWQEIRREPVSTPAGNIDVTASIGVAAAVGPCDRDFILNRADKELFIAKQTGRDKVVTAPPYQENLETVAV